jgi:hypothetical protein
MRGRIAGVSFLFLVMAILVSTFGCSKFSRPSDADVLKAIDDSGILKSPAFTITAPLAISEWGKQKEDGAWPVRVKMTLTMKRPDGSVTEPKENQTWFIISKAKDSTGRSIWKASLGS